MAIHMTELLARSRVCCRVRVGEKAEVLALAAELLAGGAGAVGPAAILECLQAREWLGSTGLGGGVALPHGRLSGIDHPIGAFFTLAPAVEYEAVDAAPIDVVFALAVPESSPDAHLVVLSGLAELFSDRGMCQRLRGAESAEQLFQVLADWRPTGG